MRRSASCIHTVNKETYRSRTRLSRTSIVDRHWVKMSRKRVGIGSAMSVVGFCKR